MLRALRARWSAIVSGPNLPPPVKPLWAFEASTELAKQWLTTSDKEIGGFSTAKLEMLTEAAAAPPEAQAIEPNSAASRPAPFGTAPVQAIAQDSNFVVPASFARFSGELSLKLGATVDRSGYAAFRTRVLRPPLSLEFYDAFTIVYRGDGRTYMVNVQGESVMPEDLYQGFLPTERGRWMKATLPFSALLLTWRGFVQPDQPHLDPRSVVSFGVCLADGAEGPFTLDISKIDAVRLDE